MRPWIQLEPHWPTAGAYWAEQLREAWGIEGELHPLSGELDLNFRVVARDGRQFVLKVMRTSADEAFVDMLCAAHLHIRSRDGSVPVPGSGPPPRRSAPLCSRPDPAGDARILWLLSMLDGQVYATCRPHPLILSRDLGGCVARMDRALADFAHPALERELKWDLRHAGWVSDHLDAIADPARRALLNEVLARHAQLLPALLGQPRTPIHNDVNDYNILVATGTDGSPRISGLLDLGDLVSGPVVAEVAIAAAYVALDHPYPERAIAALVAGYHAVTPLSGDQIDMIWPLLRTRLALSVVIAALTQKERPDDPYVVISEAPAWRYLERSAGLPEPRMTAQFRAACGLPATDSAGRVPKWLDSARGSFAPVVFADLTAAPVCSLAIAETAVPQDLTRMSDAEALALGPDVEGNDAWIGRYGEPRGVYTDAAFRADAYRGSARRTVHLGVDIFMTAGTPVHAPMDAVVEAVEYRSWASRLRRHGRPATHDPGRGRVRDALRPPLPGLDSPSRTGPARGEGIPLRIPRGARGERRMAATPAFPARRSSRRDACQLARRRRPRRPRPVAGALPESGRPPEPGRRSRGVPSP